MTIFAAYIYQYALFIAAGLLFLWGFTTWKNHTFTKRLLFRLCPLMFAILMVLRAFYTPIVITSPPNHTTIHPGDKVNLRVELTPSFLSSLFPWVGLTLYSCYTCTKSPSGVSTEGALIGSPYTFVLNIPKNQSPGEIVVEAYASMKMVERAAVRSSGVGLKVEP
jgi:hypothetical protein